MSWTVVRFIQEWSQEVKNLRKRIEEQESDEVDRIYHEVKDEVGRLLVKNESPDEATIRIHGIKMKKIIVHHKTERYNGADVYIEVENEKFALIQFKLQNGNRYKFDKTEMKNLGKWCEFCVQDCGRPLLCPTFIWLIDNSGFYDKHRILKLCKVKEILNNRQSAPKQEFERHGITRSSFKELLARCWVGAPFIRKQSIQSLTDYSALTNRVVVAFFVGV